MIIRLTKSQKSAIKWLHNRNSDGVFDKTGVLVAAGERAPIMHTTWNKLVDFGYAQKYNNNRLKLTDKIKMIDLSKIIESGTELEEI